MDQTDLPAKILLVDDDEDDYLIVRNLLSNVNGGQFELQWVQSFDEAKDIIQEARHDAYLLDYRLGAESGLELLAGMDLQEREQPFIILTGAGDQRIERKAMRLGVADYLVKGAFDGELLSRVLRYSLQRKRLEVQRVQHLLEINRSKDEFISLASHQLRTPATVVKQYIAMVLDGYVGELDEAQRAMLTRAYEGNELQLRIVNDLLHVAALDAGRVHLKKTSLNPVALVNESVLDHQGKFLGRQQQVSVKAPDKVKSVAADELKLRMVLDNLLDNASKYSDEGSAIKVEIADKDDSVCIAVSDSGVGIKAEDMGKLFQKFSRVPNRLSTEVGGSGLGLYWAQQIIDLHGGTIDVTSEEDKGTTFTISLPH
jgi:two-component system sensor histidine kinase/response regulator